MKSGSMLLMIDMMDVSPVWSNNYIHNTFLWKFVPRHSTKCLVGLTTPTPGGGSCEPIFNKKGLKNEYFPKFSSFLTKIAAKFWILVQKITIFSKNVWFWKKMFEMGALWTELHLNWGGLWTAGDAWKGGLEGRTFPIQVSAPPPSGPHKKKRRGMIGW